MLGITRVGGFRSNAGPALQASALYLGYDLVVP
jgi:hypothetical protein